MWETNNTKHIILNIAIIILILLLVGGLGFAMLRVRAMNAEHDEALSEIYVQQQQEQTAARQESLTAIQDEYDKDLQTIAQYMPGIVCWGDKTTAAVSGSLNYPYVLQTYINTYLCDVYDFRSTIENADEFARLKWEEYTMSIPVVTMAAGEESSYTILGRAGVLPYVVSKEFVIPAECEPVKIEFQSESGKSVTPLTGGDAGVNNVHIAGIEGTLTLLTDSYSYSRREYTFTRLKPGIETPVEAGTVIETAGADMYKDYIHVVLIGMYGEYRTADELVEQVKLLLSRQAKNPERFIVLGPYSHNIYSNSSSAMDQVDSAMLQAFGNRYISIRKYLVGDGYTDADISPTNEDKYYISSNMVPVSFRVSSHSEELNSRAHRLIGKLIFNRMESLGYFSEISDELKLGDSTKAILKENPSYFEDIIKNVLR